MHSMVIDKNNLPDDPALLKEMLAELAMKHENTLIEEQEKYQSLNHYQGIYPLIGACPMRHNGPYLKSKKAHVNRKSSGQGP